MRQGMTIISRGEAKRVVTACARALRIVSDTLGMDEVRPRRRYKRQSKPKAGKSKAAKPVKPAAKPSVEKRKRSLTNVPDKADSE